MSQLLLARSQDALAPLPERAVRSLNVNPQAHAAPATSIRFAGATFRAPVRFTQWKPEAGPGVYCILAADESWAPLPYGPIFFGEAEDLTQAELFSSPEALQLLATHAGSLTNLLAAHVLLPMLPAAFRTLLEQQLIAAYQPPCNHITKAPRLLLPMERHAQDQRQTLPSVMTNKALERKTYA